MADLSNATTSLQAEIREADYAVHVEWKDAKQQQICQLSFDWAWLRDNCRCSLCADPFSHQRLITGGEPLEVFTTSQPVDESAIQIEWNDGHSYTYTMSWLLRHSTLPEWRQLRQKGQRPFFWNAESLLEIPSLDYQSIMNTEEGLIAWLEHLENEGICLLRNSGTCEQAVVSTSQS